MVENYPNLICISHQFEYVSDPLEMRQGPTETDCQTLSVPASDSVAGRSVGYENQALQCTYAS